MKVLSLMALSAALLILGILHPTRGDDGGCSPTGMTPYDYSQALCMSFLFYEVQRSGDLPDDMRLDWRGDSALTDGQDNGIDLVGGYYDAGDFVKFGFPMAFSTTALAWGLIAYSGGYATAGQTDYARTAIRWATDYFLKAHSATHELWGQVGDGNVDHAYWGRPEEMTMERPSWKIDESCPGSDLSGETAAALAAAYVVFKSDIIFPHIFLTDASVGKRRRSYVQRTSGEGPCGQILQDIDSSYANQLLSASEDLFTFADGFRGTYDQCITNAQDFYKSYSGYGDELAWSALWLYKATGDQSYMDKAKSFIDEFGLMYYAETFDWDSKTAGVYALMAELDGSSTYTDKLQEYVDHLINDKPYTPQGLIYMDQWGTLRHAANVAFVGMRAASLGLQTATYNAWAQSQLDYILGSTGRSYVVGFGVSPPDRPHHRSSSCPDEPATCDWDAYYADAPNPQTLFGGLVGGPDMSDQFSDDREDYEHTEVACDYNALYSGLLAASVELH